MGAQLVKEKIPSNECLKTAGDKGLILPADFGGRRLHGSTTSLISLPSGSADSALSSFHSHLSIASQSSSFFQRSCEALYDFEAGPDLIADSPQLSIRKGERFVLFGFSEGDKWADVQSIVTERRGWVPTSYIRILQLEPMLQQHSNTPSSGTTTGECKTFQNMNIMPSQSVSTIPLEQYTWYHGAVTRSHAEYLLDACDNGGFLVRESESCPGQLVVSLRFEGRNLHYKILEINHQYSFNHHPSFPNVPGLVIHHSVQRDGLPCLLLYPAPKRAQASLLPLTNDSDNWELERSIIKLMKKIGSGQYGVVYQGIYTPFNLIVAVKTAKTDPSVNVDDFLDEAQVMKQLKHPNLVQLIGVCTRKPPYYIVAEFMKNGNLLDYLRNHSQDELTPPVLLYMARQIAYGMAYLEENCFIHRDLAARNCLVGDDHIVKIADFGLARYVEAGCIFVAPIGAKFPIKWTAPEGLAYNQFSCKSDVWSYGILLHELATYGQSPYPGVDLNDVYHLLERGHRMPQPAGCPNNIYSMMLKCWQWDPVDRPSFDQILIQITTMFEDSSINMEVAKQLAKISKSSADNEQGRQQGSKNGSLSSDSVFGGSHDSLLDPSKTTNHVQRRPSLTEKDISAMLDTARTAETGTNNKRSMPPRPPRRSMLHSSFLESPKKNDDILCQSFLQSSITLPSKSDEIVPKDTASLQHPPSSFLTIQSSGVPSINVSKEYVMDSSSANDFGGFPPPPPPINTKPNTSPLKSTTDIVDQKTQALKTDSSIIRGVKNFLRPSSIKRTNTFTEKSATALPSSTDVDRVDNTQIVSGTQSSIPQKPAPSSLTFQEELRHMLSKQSLRNSMSSMPSTISGSVPDVQSVPVPTTRQLPHSSNAAKKLGNDSCVNNVSSGDNKRDIVAPNGDEVVQCLHETLSIIHKCLTAKDVAANFNKEAQHLIQHLLHCLKLCLSCYEVGFLESAFSKFRFRDSLTQLENGCNNLQKLCTPFLSSPSNAMEILTQLTTNTNELKDLMKKY